MCCRDTRSFEVYVSPPHPSIPFCPDSKLSWAMVQKQAEGSPSFMPAFIVYPAIYAVVSLGFNSSPKFRYFCWNLQSQPPLCEEKLHLRFLSTRLEWNQPQDNLLWLIPPSFPLANIPDVSHRLRLFTCALRLLDRSPHKTGEMSDRMPSLMQWPFIATLVFASVGFLPTGQAEEWDFNKQIRPILSQHCFACHGPDEAHREAGLRLDEQDSAFAELDSGFKAIVAGSPDQSELIARILTDDHDLIMPPAEMKKPLSEKQKQLLTNWIQDGAPFARHWSFVVPQKPEVPQTASTSKNPIDQFISQKLQQQNLKQQPTAKPHLLMRRLALDLTGLPPTADQLQRFGTNPSDEDLKIYLNELLASGQYGVHMARYWLDLVRYADTHGLHLDNYREMWPYRDWVVNAYNQNMPFDQFVIEQMAGDLLPNATVDQQIASGFNRLHVTTNEGGSIYEEVYTRNVIERVDGFGTIFLGLTTGCAVCHDHKFDPISMKDYYSLFAFFNNLDGRAMDGNRKDPAPVIKVPSETQKQQFLEILADIQKLEKQFANPMPEVDQAQQQWAERLRTDQPFESGTSIAKADWHTLKPESSSPAEDLQFEFLDDGSTFVTGANSEKVDYINTTTLEAGQTFSALRLNVLTHDSHADKGAGRSPNANAVLSEIEVFVQAEGQQEWQPVKLAKAYADHSQTNGKFDIRYAIDGKVVADEGWAIEGFKKRENRFAVFQFESPVTTQQNTKLQVVLKHQSMWGKHAFGRYQLQLTTAPKLSELQPSMTPGPWFVTGPFETETASVTYGRKFASEGKDFKPDQVFKYAGKDFPWVKQPDWYDTGIHPLISEQAKSTSATVLSRTLEVNQPTKVTLLLGSDDGCKVYLNKKQIYQKKGPRLTTRGEDRISLDLKKGKNQLTIKVVNHQGTASFSSAFRDVETPVPETLQVIAKTEPEQRTDDQQQMLTYYYRAIVSENAEINALRKQQAEAHTKRQKLEEQIPTTLVFREQETERPAYILLRGQYDAQGDQVQRAVPEAIAPFRPDWPKNRLGLAYWLLDDQNPLTARVFINRLWQQFFGVGLVKTSEDFGSQGETPSHPELLDWLAMEFRESGWDIKHMVQLIVTSETYRRSPVVDSQLLAADPDNRLLGRGPRFRLDAELIRDQALHLAGLLNLEMGGPSVKPPQPEGLWAAVGFVGSNTDKFVADKETEKIYRRSLYTFWKRTAPPPSMSTFDAPSRESCIARRERTNTPLQALALMNEQQYFQASRQLATRMLKSAQTDQARLVNGLTWALSRAPQAEEVADLLLLIQRQQELFASDPTAASQVVSEQMTKQFPEMTAEQLAAWTMTANLILNLDEVVSKN